MKISVAAALLFGGTVSAAPLFKTRASPTPGNGVSHRELHGLSAHFQGLHAAAKANAGNVGEVESTVSRGSSASLASLPATAAPALGFDPSLFLMGADLESEFAALLKAELAAHSAYPAPSTTFPYVLCGPQASASAARKALTEATGRKHHEVTYASRIDDTACWSASLTLAQYRGFVSPSSLVASPFFAAAPMPQAAKFGPGLIVNMPLRKQQADGDANLSVSAHAFADTMGKSSGIRILLQKGKKKLEEVTKWTRDGFGLSGDHTDEFFPLTGAEMDTTVGNRHAHPGWARTRHAASTGKCPSIVDVEVPSGGRAGSNLRVVFTKKKTNSTIAQASGADDKPDPNAIHHDHCALLALAYLAAQPEVRTIDVAPLLVTKSAVEGKPVDQSVLDEITKEVSRVKGAAEGAKVASMLSSAKSSKPTSKSSPAPKDFDSAVSLQSGDAANPTPYWDIGVDGTSQFVQVVDTGFDDASCLLRDGPKEGLSGNQSDTLQVSRTVYDEYSFVPPTTDYNLRKIISYTAVNHSTDFYQDYEAGHGTHVVGIVVGEIYNASEPIVFEDEAGSICEYYTNASNWDDDFIGPNIFCEYLFCDTCYYAYQCDRSCGRVASNKTNAYTGMAPKAQVNAFDVGDAYGNLHIPDDYYGMFLDGFMAGAKFHSNSWGIGPPYNYYDYGSMMLDTFMYYIPEQLVLVAAGNEGSSDGDASIGSPAGAKNCLTVGAAETKETPDTVATFSSRGPYNDGRIKPDVCGPGNPVNSARASGDAGLATCGILTISGTSMATPALAGTAALVRQFLVEGQHEQYSPYGYNFSNYSVTNPTAALIKAMLIGSTAQLLYGYNSTGFPVTLSKFYGATTAKADTVAYPLGTPTVDFTQGFGHTQLTNIVPLDFTFNTFLYELEIGAYTNMSSTYFVNSTSTKIDLTLVWTDPPGYQYCDQYYVYGYSNSSCLVHYLDLQVYVAGERKYSNFGGSTTGGIYTDTEDTMNNVEKITLPVGSFQAGDEILVVVQSHGLSYAASQTWALAITGNLELSRVPTLAPTLVPSPSSTATSKPTLTHNPTSMPTILPTPTPTNPSSLPTNAPIPQPSGLPVPMPTAQPFKTPAPTAPQPTASDTVKVDVDLVITASSALTSTLAKQLKGTIASQLGMTEANLKEYEYSDSPGLPIRRNLLQAVSAYDWAVEFKVEVSLASTDASSADDLATEIGTDLSSNTFQAAVMTDLGVVVTSVSASSAVVTSAPTPVIETSSVKAAGLAWWAILLIAVFGALIVAAGAVAAIMCARRGQGGEGLLKHFPFGYSSESSNFDKFKEEGQQEINPLGEAYPATFTGGSVTGKHNDL